LVAIKVPHPEVESDPTLFDRFKREEEIGTKIDQPDIMKVLPNPDRTQVYMVMEWLEGRLLRQIMNEQKRLPVDRAVKLTVAICHALEHIHAEGVVHRDLKPENIMVGPGDSVHLIDFGIAASAGSRRLTFAHFSQSIYEMLTGQVPFTGANPFAVMNDRLLNQPVPPRKLDPEITPQMQEILYRALEREPKNRYASAREMAHDLEHQDQVGVAERTEAAEWEKRKSPEERRWLLYAGLALIPVVVFVVMFLVAKR
jgi:serine/threonine-protein kinase